MGEVILTMKDIDKSFPGVHALDHVNFEVKRGEVHALMGENGAGKSTLMKVLAGIYKQEAGDILIEGKKVQITEGVVTGRCQIEGHDTVIAIMDSHFMMGSMGSVVGEKVTRAVEYATAHELPIIIFTTSGGARMQEGILSLMQMAKTSAALKRHHDAGCLYVSVLTDPTTGGVTASFAMLGDIILAEPKALIGFAGQRVIQGTIHQKLPEGFQRAEFQLKNGFVDRIVHREKMREELGRILKLHSRK